MEERPSVIPYAPSIHAPGKRVDDLDKVSAFKPPAPTRIRVTDG